MDTPVKNLSKEEKENVLTVLNEFTEEYKISAQSVEALVGSVNELSAKIILFLDRPESPKSENEAIAQLEESIANSMEKIAIKVQNTSLPNSELREVLEQMEKNILLFQNPIPQKMIHHHHVPKIIWIAAGLFLVVALVAAGWYMTAGKLDGYIASDTKYRYLKLDTGNIYLQKLLYRVDSLSRNTPSMRDAVINKEEENRNNLELLQKASQMNAEAENLKA
ncbi:MAG: hypothetical protein ABJC98_20040, partial [Bacteroidota bacterium]